MPKILIFILLILPSLALGLTKAGQSRIRALESRGIPELRVPAMQRWDLANGWHMILLEDHELPLISAQMMIRASTVFVAPDKVGTAGILTRLLRSGGTVATAPDQQDDELDRMAVRIHDSMTNEAATVTLSTLSRYAASSFRYFFEMIFTPRFDAGRFDGIQKRRLDELRRQNDVPGEVAQREFLVWMEGHSPWGMIPTRKTVSHVSLPDVRRYYQDHLIRGEKWLVVVGDITRPQLEALLVSAIPMDNGPAVTEALPQLQLPTSPGVRIVRKKATQTAIVMGHAATDRHNPDKYALLVMNDILGGSPFTNRLMKTIRTEKGLAYSTGSSFGFGPKAAPGLFVATAMTKAEKTGEVVGLMKDIIGKMQRGEGLTEADLNVSKRSIISSTLFEFANAFGAATTLARFDLYDYPANYIQEFRSSVMKVTVNDVKRVAAQYLHPEQLRILVVGDPKVLTPLLGGFGKVEVVDPSN